MISLQSHEPARQPSSELQAVQAWCDLQRAHIEPGHVEILKLKHKVATYRLHGVGPYGSAVIAKKCREATGNVERMIYERVLPRLPVPTLQCFGFLDGGKDGFCWL